MLQKERDKCSQ